MTILIDPDGPLPCPGISFVVDPGLADAVEAEYDLTILHNPTSGPNRYTLHVPTEHTVLSLGQLSPRWKTDLGITGYTDSHIHFETWANHKTVVSLGGPATTSNTKGFADKPPVATQGYSMVTEDKAWHDSLLQHYLVSRTEDMSVRTAGANKRAVVQADHGKVDVTGGEQVNVSGGGVSIAAGELEVEDVRYGGSWEGKQPHSSAAAATQIAAAAVAFASSIVDVGINQVRDKFKEGEYAGGPEGWGDKAKFVINAGLMILAELKLLGLISEPTSPEKCVKISAPEIVGAMAGGDISIFGMKSVTLASAGWTTVSAGVSASLKSMLFGGVGGAFTSLKGYRKVEMGSDWGKVFVGAQKEIHLEAEDKLNGKSGKAFHVASPSGAACFGGEKVWLGTTTAVPWGLKLEADKLSLGKAKGADKMSSAEVVQAPSLTISDKNILVKTPNTALKLEGKHCTISSSKQKVRFKATSGPVTINSNKILVK